MGVHHHCRRCVCARVFFHLVSPFLRCSDRMSLARIPSFLRLHFHPEDWQAVSMSASCYDIGDALSCRGIGKITALWRFCDTKIDG